MNEEEKNKIIKLSQKACVSEDEAKAALETNEWDILDAMLYLQNKKQQSGSSYQNMEQGTSQFNNNSNSNTESEYTTSYNNTGAVVPAVIEVYSTGNENASGSESYQYKNNKSTSFGEAFGKFWNWCKNGIKMGFRNDFIITRKDNKQTRIPIFWAVVILIITNWLCALALIIGALAGYWYSFEGPDIKRSDAGINDSINKAKDKTNQFFKNFRENMK